MMTSTAPSHSAALNPHASNHAPSSSSTYRTQTLPIAVPLPDFWHQQRPSTLNATQYGHPQQPPRDAASTSKHALSHGPSVTVAAAPPHHAWATSSSSSSGRSHQQSHQQPPSCLPAHTAPLRHAPPPYPHQQQQQPNTQYYSQIPASSCYYREPASTDNALPIHHHYPVASTSTAKASTPQSSTTTLPVQKAVVEQAEQSVQRAAASSQSNKAPSSSRHRSATVEAQQQKSDEFNQQKVPPASDTDIPSHEKEGGGEGEEEIDEDPELTARFSSVSQIEAQPTLDPKTGEAIYPCPFCDKSYGGKHARSIWRRHLSNKHGIPLNLQPRRTRWDNDVNRPKDEAERHKRTLESKRRWAAKNRAEKRAKRKGTTVEEELGLIEAAEAAEAAAAGNNAQEHEQEHNFADGSFNTSNDSTLLAHAPQYQDRQYSYTTTHQRQATAYYQEAVVPSAQPLTTLDSHIPYATQAIRPSQNTSVSVHADNRTGNPPVTYVQQGVVPSDYATSTYLQVDAGHQPYSIVYPVYAVSSENPSEVGRYQRSPTQPGFPTHVQQANMSYNASVSPVDGSFEHQQQQQIQPVQYLQPVYASQPTEQNLQNARLLQSVPLAQQPFLAPPSTQHAPSLQRSVSAPIPQRAQFDREYTPEHMQHIAQTQQNTSQVQYIQHGTGQQPIVAAAPSVGRPASSNGMTIYIPPPQQPIQGWPQQSQSSDLQHSHTRGEQVTPLAHTVPVYSAAASANSNVAHPQHQQQQPPTPYFFLSMPESTPVAEQQPPVSTVLRPVPLNASIMVNQQPTQDVQLANSTTTSLATNASVSGPLPVSTKTGTNASEADVGSTKENGKSKRRKESKKKTSAANEGGNSRSKTNRKKPHTPAAIAAPANIAANAVVATMTEMGAIPYRASQITKTYQEAAMQLLALASSSPPPSPARELVDPLERDNDDDEEAGYKDASRSTDAEGSVYAEDSGYAHFHEAHYSERESSKQVSRLDQKHHQQQVIADEEDEEDDDEENQFSRFADIPPSSPAQLRMSLSPESSPLQSSMNKGPSKLSATYLRAQASVSATPLGMKRKKYNNSIINKRNLMQNDENYCVSVLGDVSGDEEEESENESQEGERGERISLDSSPERTHEEDKMDVMKAPSAKRRLLSMSSVSPDLKRGSGLVTREGGMRGRGGDRAFRRIRQSTTTTTSGTSRSPSPSRFTNNNGTSNSGMSSSFATSVIMSTPHQHPDLVSIRPPSVRLQGQLSRSQGEIQGNKSSSMAFPSSSSSSLPTGLGMFSFNENRKENGLNENQKGHGIDYTAHYNNNNNDNNGRARGQHAHRSSIFKIDNCSRPSAVFSTSLLSSSSPTRPPYLLSSPEHAAVSKSLGLVPDNFNHNNSNTSTGFINLPSDGEGFELNFLKGYNHIDNSSENRGFGNDSNTASFGYNASGDTKIGKNGLSEYAKDVFGGLL